jgi:hypothetical protein
MHPLGTILASVIIRLPAANLPMSVALMIGRRSQIYESQHRAAGGGEPFRWTAVRHAG